MIPGLFRKVEGVQYQRERINTPDDDFIDLDWSSVDAKRLVIVLHGLEGNADRPYVRGVVKMANKKGWDGLGMNFRGCSGETNRTFRSYHSGDTEDLDTVIQHVLLKNKYEEITIVGFSLGGNVTLKYAGERGTALNPIIKKVAGISVPVDLYGCSRQIERWFNYAYKIRFLQTLKEKSRLKEKDYPGAIDYQRLYNAKSIFEFDDAYTGPVHGFEGAVDYYTKSSSLQFLDSISVPFLLINAKDDSFLSDSCYPYGKYTQIPHFQFDTPKNGGHVGFYTRHKDGFFWTEHRLFDFLQNS